LPAIACEADADRRIVTSGIQSENPNIGKLQEAAGRIGLIDGHALISEHGVKGVTQPAFARFGLVEGDAVAVIDCAAVAHRPRSIDHEDLCCDLRLEQRADLGIGVGNVRTVKAEALDFAANSFDVVLRAHIEVEECDALRSILLLQTCQFRTVLLRYRTADIANHNDDRGVIFEEARKAAFTAIDRLEAEIVDTLARLETERPGRGWRTGRCGSRDEPCAGDAQSERHTKNTRNLKTHHRTPPGGSSGDYAGCASLVTDATFTRF
jgi:hypothetical protein